MVKILISSLLMIMLTSCVNSGSEAKLKSFEGKFTLQIEETSFNSLTGKFVEMEVDVLRRKFSKPKYIDFEQLVFKDEILPMVMETEGLVTSDTRYCIVEDVSPDGKWAIIRKVTGPPEGRPVKEVYLLYDLDYKKVEEQWPSYSQDFSFSFRNGLFSRDSDGIYFLNWTTIMKYSIETKDVSETGQKASALFLSPDRMAMFYFNEGNIIATNVTSLEEEIIGSYKKPAVAYSGLIDNRYAYFVTGLGKTPRYFHILDLHSYEITTCPFMFEGKVVGKKNSNE